MALSLSLEHEETLRAHLRGLVRGFGDLATVVDDGVDYMVGTAEIPRGLAEQFAAEELEALRAEQESWPAVTDNDRLDLAFDTLNNNGVFAAQDYWCCSTCGHSAAYDELVQSKGKYNGYVFFHQQDTESGVRGAGVYLGFGHKEADGDAKDAAIAQQAIDELTRRGLRVTWNGSALQRPLVQLEWQRRR
jgi:hypothetical protein